MRLLAAIFLLCTMSFQCAAQSASREDQLTAVRRLASISVYLQRCPRLAPGPNLSNIGLSKGVLPSDLAEGGRFRATAIEHAATMKALDEMSGGKIGKESCARALEQYGPSGYVERGALIERK